MWGTPAVGIRVLIVGDRAVFQRGLREHLERNGVEVVGEAEDGDEAVRMALEFTPGVVLMDARIKGASSVEAIRHLTEAYPGARVLVLAASAEDDLVPSISAGACGLLLKDEEGDRVLAAIAAAAAGQSPVSPALAAVLLGWVREHQPPSRGSAAPELTARERQVLDLIVAGRDNSEIAAELVISPETVKTHVSAILAKLRVDNRVQAAVAAVIAGLVTPAS